MKHNKLMIFTIIVSLMAFPVFGGAAQDGDIAYKYTPGLASITTPDLYVKVTSGGNVPQYFFSANTEPDVNDTSAASYPTDTGNFKLAQGSESQKQNDENGQGNNKKQYFVKFLSIFEFEDVNSNGFFDSGDKRDISSKITFPSNPWNFSDFETDETDGKVTAVHFNFTHEGTPNIVFRNHIYSSETHKIKFDVIINDYEWHNSTDNVKLALRIHFGGIGTVNKENNNTLEMNDAFFKFEETAVGANGDIGVTSNLEGNNAFYLIYDYFGDSLNHDPEIGISDDGAGIPVPLFPVLGALAFFGVIPIIRRRK